MFPRKKNTFKQIGIYSGGVAFHHNQIWFHWNTVTQLCNCSNPQFYFSKETANQALWNFAQLKRHTVIICREPICLYTHKNEHVNVVYSLLYHHNLNFTSAHLCISLFPFLIKSTSLPAESSERKGRNSSHFRAIFCVKSRCLALGWRAHKRLILFCRHQRGYDVGHLSNRFMVTVGTQASVKLLSLLQPLADL